MELRVLKVKAISKKIALRKIKKMAVKYMPSAIIFEESLKKKGLMEYVVEVKG